MYKNILMTDIQTDSKTIAKGFFLLHFSGEPHMSTWEDLILGLRIEDRLDELEAKCHAR